jgi:hypothetical protein
MITLYQDEDCWLAYQYEESLGKYTMHTTVKEWSLSKYKKYLNVFTDAMMVLENRGIKEVYSVCFTDKAVKFNQLFGFRLLGITKTINKEDVYLMRFENVWE